LASGTTIKLKARSDGDIFVCTDAAGADALLSDYAADGWVQRWTNSTGNATSTGFASTDTGTGTGIAPLAMQYSDSHQTTMLVLSRKVNATQEVQVPQLGQWSGVLLLFPIYTQTAID
jgi:hypothetical protein